MICSQSHHTGNRITGAAAGHRSGRSDDNCRGDAASGSWMTTSDRRESDAGGPDAGAVSMLEGIRVVELADEQAEYTGLLLGGLGADVVKVEPLDGAPTR